MALKDSQSSKMDYDYQLIKEALEKSSQKAYAELVERYKKTLYFTIYKIVQDKDDAEDLTIESFAKAFEQLPNYSPNYAFSTWLFKIANNRCIDFLRKNNKESKRLFYFAGAMGNDPEQKITFDIKCECITPEEAIIKKQHSDYMRSIVHKLKPHYATLIELRYFNDYSYEEIAQQLNLPLGSVKGQLSRAKQLLQKMLNNKQETL